MPLRRREANTFRAGSKLSDGMYLEASDLRISGPLQFSAIREDVFTGRVGINPKDPTDFFIVRPIGEDEFFYWHRDKHRKKSR